MKKEDKAKEKELKDRCSLVFMAKKFSVSLPADSISLHDAKLMKNERKKLLKQYNQEYKNYYYP